MFTIIYIFKHRGELNHLLITDAQDIIKKPEEPATAGKGESMEFRLLIIEDEPDIGS